MSTQEQERLAIQLLYVVAVAAALGAVAYVLLAVVTVTTAGQLPPLRDGVWGMVRVPWHTGEPAAAFSPQTAGMLPGAATFWGILSVLLLLVLAMVVWLLWRVDAMKGRRAMALRWYDPRSKLTPRSFARPRDLRHLRSGDPDSWTTLRLDGRMIGTGPQTHVLTIAPTRSGKTTGPVTTWALEHQGPALITSTKTDIVTLTAGARMAHGPVWVYAPGLPASALPVPACGWTPLDGCATWEGAQMTAKWLAANTIGSGDVQESDGGRFYNKEAGRVLAALLYAAKLSGRDMLSVNRWLRAEDAEPLRVLRAAGATLGADVLESFRKTDAKPRTLTIATCGQLIDAYEFESVQSTDYSDFSPAELMRGGTLYLVAPESRQEMVGPLFSALLGAVFREAEMHNLQHGPLNPTLRVILDEASRLAATDDLPALLSVSAGWGVRIATVWQNLDQITARYGRKADEVLGNSLVQLILGPIQDRGTREHLVGLLDAERVDDMTYDLDGLGGRHARSAARRDRDKVSAQTLQQLALGEGLLICSRELPAKGQVLPYWKRRDLRRMVKEGQERLPQLQQAAQAHRPPAGTAAMLTIGKEARGGRRVLEGMSDAAALIVQARKRQGITVEQLGNRAGIAPTQVIELEAGRHEPDTQELAAILLICGLQLEQSSSGTLAVRPLKLDVDEQELAHTQSLSVSERLRSSMGWNSFADRIHQAGQRARS